MQLQLATQHNIEYYGEIGMGTPAQRFKVLFDTGSANTWLPSSSCPTTDIACQRHKQYNSQQSSSYVANGSKFSLAYGAGMVSGYLSQDTLHLAGAQLSGLTFGEITQHHQTIFESMSFDGIVGLAFAAIAWHETTPFLELLCQQRKIQQCLFSVYLRQQPVAAQAAGELLFGGVNSARYKGELHYVPVSGEGYWQIQLSGVAVRGKLIDNNVAAIVDTGTSLILLPQRVLGSLYAALGARMLGDIYSLSCKLEELPAVAMHLGNFTLTLTPADYVVEIEGLCISIFVPFNYDFWVLGDVFLRRYYTVYDAEGSGRMGFAEAV
ncbi:CG5860, partial [Drosophila busckii]